VDTFKELGKLPVPFEAIIIELSGMADPAPVAFTFTNTELEDKFRVDSIGMCYDTSLPSIACCMPRPPACGTDLLQLCMFCIRHASTLQFASLTRSILHSTFTTTAAARMM
jgi:hypothetical protein